MKCVSCKLVLIEYFTFSYFLQPRPALEIDIKAPDNNCQRTSANKNVFCVL